MAISVHRKNLGAFYWATSGANLVLRNLVNRARTFNAIDPATISSLGGNDSNTSLLLKFDGNTNDASSFSQTVIQDGAAAGSYVSGKFNQALNFTGANVGYHVANTSDFQFGSGDFTIDCWLAINSTVAINQQQFINKSDGTTTDWYFFYAHDISQFRFGVPALGLELQANVVGMNDNIFHHVAVVRSGNTYTLYVDGINKTSGSVGGAVPNTPTATIGIGHYAGDFTQSLDGKMDELRVSKGIARWTSGFTPPTSAYTATSKTSIFTQAQLDSNFKFTTSSDVTVTAADYLDSNWSANGWTTGTDSTFYTELETFIKNNYGQSSINFNSQDMVVVITRGNIGGSSYSIPFCFIGNKGDPSGIDAATAFLLHLDGNLTDVSANAYTSSVDMGALTYGAGKFGQAAHFDGATRVAINHTFAFGTADWTIDFWFKQEQDTAGKEWALIQQYALGGGVDWLVIHEHQQIAFEVIGPTLSNATVGTASSVIMNSVTVPFDSNFHHIAVVRNSGIMRIFYDGAVIAECSINNTAFPASTPATMGYPANTANTVFGVVGSVDEMRISQGIARWTSSFTPPTSAYPTTPGTTVSFSLLDSEAVPVGSFLGSTGPFSPLPIQGNYLYAISYTNNLFQIWDISNPSNLTLVSSKSTSENGYSGAHGSVVSGNYLFVGMNNSSAINIYNISNPASPTYVNNIALGAGGNSFFCIQGNLLYSAAGGGGAASGQIKIYDISNINSITQVGATASNLGGNLYYPVLSGNFLYVPSENDNTLRIFNVSNPASPTHVSSTAVVTSPRYVALSGNYVYVAATGSNNLVVFDISNPASPVLVKTIPLPPFPETLVVQGNYLYVSTGGSGARVYVLDITVQSAPVVVSDLYVSGASINYGMNVNGNFAYITDYNSHTLKSFSIS